MKTCEVLDLKKSCWIVYSKPRSAGSSFRKEFQKKGFRWTWFHWT